MRAIETTASTLVDEAIERQLFDFARDVSSAIPIAAICEMLGIPTQDRDYLAGLTGSSLSSEEGGLTRAETFVARNEILIYFAELARERRRDQEGDDLISLLATADIDGSKLTTDEIVLNCFNLLVAGIETSRLAMNGAMVAFAEEPDQWRKVRDREVDISAVVDEVVRWTTPAIHVARTTMQDTELAGQALKEGDVVSVWLSSANRDETVIDRPFEFDVARTRTQHIAFSLGPHLCTGAQLARLEIGVVIESIVHRVDEISLQGGPRTINSNFLRGFCEVPLTFTPSSA